MTLNGCFNPDYRLFEVHVCSRFLFHKNSAAYQQYRQHVEQFRAELGSIKQAENCSKTIEYQPEDIYEPDNLTDDEHFDNNSRNV